MTLEEALAMPPVGGTSAPKGVFSLDEAMALPPAPNAAEQPPDFQGFYQKLQADHAQHEPAWQNALQQEYDYNESTLGGQIANNPIVRGVAQGVKNLGSQTVESAIRYVVPAVSSADLSPLADEIGKRRSSEEARQQFANQQQGTVAGLVQKVSQMLTEFAPAPLLAGKSLMIAQMASNGANDAYARSGDLPPEQRDMHALESAAVNATFGLLGSKLAGGLTPEVLTGLAPKAANLLRGYAGEAMANVGQLFTQHAVDKFNDVGDGELKPEQLLETLAVTVLGRAAAHGVHKAGEFIDSPSRRTAKAAGVDEVATTQQERQDLAAGAKDTLSVEQFRKQLDDLAAGGRITPEQSRYLYYMMDARAKGVGEKLADYIGKRLKGIETTTRQDTLDKLGQTDVSGRDRGHIDFKTAEDGRAIIRIFENGNLATAVHEFSHLFRRDLSGKDLATAASWSGAPKHIGVDADGSPIPPDTYRWHRTAEEKFARGFEKYVHDGKAPTPAMERIYNKFSNWMHGLYKTVVGTKLDMNIPDHMREVYDRMFGGNGSLGKERAETARRNSPIPARPEAPSETAAPEDFALRLFYAGSEETSPAAPETAPAPEADVLSQNRGLSATSLKNAQVDQERVARGLEQMMSKGRQTNAEAWDGAMKRIDADPHWQDNLTAELTDKPRAVTPEENAGLLHKRVTLRNEYHDALEAWQQGDPEAEQRVNAAAARMADFEDVTRSIGTKSGQSLQARKMMAEEDYSLAKMEMETRQAKGRDITPEERTHLVKTQKTLEELQAKVDAAETESDAKAETAAVDEAIKETQREARKRPAKSLDPEQEKTAAVDSIKTKLEKDAPNEIHTDLQKLARMFWQQGVREREPMIDALHGAIKDAMPKDWTRQQTQRAFSGYGDFKPVSKDEITAGLADLKTQTQQVLKIEALENRQPLEKTGIERRPLTDAARRLVKQVNELKKKYGVTVTDPATQLKGALEARKTYYKNRMADLKHEIESRQRTVKGSTPPPTDAELDGMMKEHAQLKEDHAAIFGKSNLTDEQRLQLAIKSARRLEETWNEKLAKAKAGDFSKPPKTNRKQNSFALMSIEARTDVARQQYKELLDLANPKKTPEQIALQSLKTRMATETAKLKEKLAAGDFAKVEHKPVALDEAAAKLKADLDLARKAYKEGLEKDRWARSSIWEKTKRHATDAYDLGRVLMTTGEFSFVLRQGKWQALAHPVSTAKAMGAALRAMRSEHAALTIESGILDHPKYPEAKAAKLHIAQTDAPLSRQEEMLIGRLVGKIPGIKAFDRAGRTFLNKLRFDTYLALEKGLTKSGTATPEERHAIALFVNESTGRGGLGKVGEPAAVALGRAFFSPRYFISRLQLAAGHSMWGGSMRSRRIVAGEYARAIAGLGVYYTLLSWGLGDKDKKTTIELDPRSTDFGKVKIGDTRLDPLAGLAQIATFGARMATGETKDAKGKITSLRNPKFGGRDVPDVIWSFLRSKLHPAPGTLIDLLATKDFGGQSVTMAGEAAKLTPLTYRDIWDALKEQGYKDGAALSLLAFFGEGLQSYAKKK